MTAILETSSMFASATAEGVDWRDVGRKILEKLESVRTDDDGMSIGFLYVTDPLAEDLASLLALLKNITRIQNWYGSVGTGICGGGKSFAGLPAAVAMIGRLPAGSFQGFQFAQKDTGGLPASLRLWSTDREAGVAVVHGILGQAAVSRMTMARERDGLYTVGGFTSQLIGGAHIAEGTLLHEPALSGVAIDSAVRIMTATSMGCHPAGTIGRITQCGDSAIHSIDDKPALDFLKEAVENLDPGMKNGDERAGNIHAAFPVTGSDTVSYLVRNITGVDEKSGTLNVAHNFARGDSVRFVYRDNKTAEADLARTLAGLHARATAESGATNHRPKGVLYFGCGARQPREGTADEAAIIRDVLGDVPMAGFYTAAEICNGHVFGYTGVVLLFL